ncbi:MAG: menaquinone biosynthetic enzyme MqnA/MqnD family protein [Pyrinomonadaceae bacterium]
MQPCQWGAYFVASRALTFVSEVFIISSDAERKPRLAASDYLNSAPLIWSFKQGSRKDKVTLVEAVPALCAELLASGKVDIALIPAIEYQRITGVELVPDVCIASRESVRSVILATKFDDLKEVDSVALDESSRTSATLVKIIFREFFGFEPQWTSAAPDLHRMLTDNDAALIIGDPGMVFSRKGLNVFDVATLWRRHTGLGFVFALWAIGPDASKESRRLDFVQVRDEGLRQAEEIIDFYQSLLGLSREELWIYLHDNISFSLDHELIAGLNLFYKLAFKHDLVPALKPLRL